MTVRAVWTRDAVYDVTGSGYAPDGTVLRDGAPATLDDDVRCVGHCSRAPPAMTPAPSPADGGWAVLGDPTEGAMVVVAAGGSASIASLCVGPCRGRVHPVQLGSPIHGDTAPGRGARHVAHRCEGCGRARARVVRFRDGRRAGTNATARRPPRLSAANALAGQGLRVIATAVRRERGDTSFWMKRHSRARSSSRGCRRCWILRARRPSPRFAHASVRAST